MTDLAVISSKQKRLGYFLSISIGITLAFSLLPGIHTLFSQIVKLGLGKSWIDSPIPEMALFIFSSLLFFISLPRHSRQTEVPSETLIALAPSLILPVLIAFTFGWFVNRDFIGLDSHKLKDLFWFVLCIPLGEELLFRGWLWSIFRAIFKNTFFSLTNPLPSALIFSSLSFSLWHLQNFSHISAPFLIFQLMYTFFTGVWLGYLRWRTGQITSSILAHALINLAASLPCLL
jgi:membrane protease YdiL (CAAX protease family)